MNHGDVLVIGGTSDARAICQQLDAADVRYTLSVATPTGQRLAGDIKGRVRCGRLEPQQMVDWLTENRTRWVIDASHPYAEVVSRNILTACETVGVLLSRYQRPEQLSELTHPLLYSVPGIEEACDIARRLGERVLLTTGSKDLALWRTALPEKTLLEAPTAGEGATCRSCAHCPWMAMNGLKAIAEGLEQGGAEHEIHVDEALRTGALIPLNRMLDFAATLRG